MAELLPPTGLKIESFVRDNIIEWHGSDNPAVQGFNVYVSTTPGGGQSRFLRLNNNPIRTPNRVDDIVETQGTDEVETLLDSTAAEKVIITRQRVRKVRIFQFHHIDVDMNSVVSYVITSVGIDGDESGFSTELIGETRRIDGTIVNSPPREFDEIVTGIIDVLLRRNPQIDLKPGTVVRDLVIDPQAFEMSDLWTFLNFIDKSTSLTALRQLDDENDDSISDPVSQSEFKQRLRSALSLTNDEDVQTLIDYAIEKLASNFRVFRKAARESQGAVVFFSETRPTGDVEIPAGTAIWTDPDEVGTVINFSTDAVVTVSEANVDLQFNSARNRFEFTASVTADEPGPEGNVSVGAIVNTNIGQFQVENPKPMFGGDDEEDNSIFTERAIFKVSSLDVGTRKGYRRVLLEQSGVQDVFVADAGDPLMQRDFIRRVASDGTVKSEHIFGKVDLWLRGGEIVVFEDRAGFLFTRAEKESFDIAERISAFIIETTNPDVDETKPIFEVEEIIRQRAGFPDANFLLDNLIIEDGGRRLRIDTDDATNVGVGLQEGDTVLVTYRFRGSDPIQLLRQPVSSTVSVEGLNSGTLDEGTHWEFVNTADFLLDGLSVADTASIQLKFDSVSQKPLGTIAEFSERAGNRDGFVLTSEFQELSKRGIILDTIVVLTIPLDGSDPIALVRNRNYILETDEANGTTSIRLIGSDARFPAGQRYSITYSHGEEIVIRYRANNLIDRMQTLIDTQSRHEAADVLVKAARAVEIDVIFSFKALEGADALDVKQRVMDVVRIFIAGRRMGQSVFESDLIFQIQQVDGVKHVILPLAKLARVDRSYETGEIIQSEWSQVIVGTSESGEPVSYFQTPQNALQKNTLGTSSEPNEFWGLRENGTPLKVVDGVTALVAERGTFFIDVTGTVFVNPKSVDEVGNMFNDPDANNNEYAATYRIAGESGSQDIIIQPNEFAQLADLIIEVVDSRS